MSSGIVREFLSALRQPATYALARNGYAVFGLLWGLPIPFFSVGIDLWASGRSFAPAILVEHPIHLVFLAHPIFFAVVFGAMGVIRQRKDAEIARLVGELERHVGELAAANGKLKELDRLKAQFVANVTHELKTPLVAIRGYNESILEQRFGPLTDKQREGLTVAVRNVDRLQRLIEELLEFERIDAGALRLDVAEFDLVPVAQAALRAFQPAAEAKKLDVQVRLPASLVVRADREKIARVLLNLVSNAVKFTPAGAALGLNAAAGDDGATVTVWDRGPGIPTDAQQFLFTRFWQADGSARRRHGGTGLGLAICKGILDAHGAAIRVVSSEGAGTMVHFTLPLAAKESADAGRQAAGSRR
jgi:signal transduction histidine kinase